MPDTFRVLSVPPTPPGGDMIPGVLLDVPTGDPDAMRAAIGGGWLEAITNPDGWALYLDEEGGPEIKNLPVNILAGSITMHLNGGRRLSRELRGTVAFFGYDASSGDETDVPQAVIDAHTRFTLT